MDDVPDALGRGPLAEPCSPNDALVNIVQKQAADVAELLRVLAVKKQPLVSVRSLWLAFELAEKYRLATWRDYAQRWRDHVGPVFGVLDASAIEIAALDKYRSDRRAAGAAVATVNREIALLRRLLNFGVRRKLIDKSPLHGPGMTKELIHAEHNARTTVIEEDPAHPITLDALLAHADVRLGAMIVLVHHSGMRRAEAARLRWDRIDRKRGIAWIPSAETKGGHGGRTVPISSRTLLLLDALPRYPDSPWVFGSRHHGVRGRDPISADYWTHAFGKLVRRMKLDGPDGPPWFHDLRRSFVTLSRRDGELEVDIMKITAHKTTAVFRRYDVHDPRDVLRFRERREDAREELRSPRKGPQRADNHELPDVNVTFVGNG